MIAAAYLLLMGAAAQAQVVIHQTTTGWCSPNIHNVTGKVTVNCKGVDPRALVRLNVRLTVRIMMIPA